MVRNPTELSVAIQSAVNRKAVVFSHVALISTIIFNTLFDPSSTPWENYLSLAVSGGLLVFIFLRFFDLAQINKRPLLTVAMYVVITFLGLTFLSTPVTPYMNVTMISVFLVNLYYGGKGVFWAVMAFGAATAFKLVYFSSTDPPLTKRDVVGIIISFLVFAAVCSFYSNLQKVYDWDRNRLKDTIKQATLEEKRLRALINNMTESVLVLDDDGMIRLHNAAAQELLNTHTNLGGKKLREVATFENEKGETVDFEKLVATADRSVRRTDLRIKYAADDYAALSMNITPLKASFDGGEKESGTVVTLRDITRQKSLEQERNEFISVVSHELRTPVTITEAGISNAMYVNASHGNDTHVDESLKMAHAQSLYLAKLLNDLSDFDRAEKDTLDVVLDTFNPADVVVLLENDYRPQAEEKHMQVKAVISDRLPATITSSSLYVKEILQNFVSNAVKYSDSGTVTISVQPAKNGVEYRVSDEGIGITISDQKKVFDKFFRSENYESRSRNGTGLGLYVAQKLAKTINATIDLESEVGKGSTFSLIVPSLTETKNSEVPKKSK